MSVFNQDSLMQIINGLKKICKEDLTLSETEKKIIGREVNIVIENDKVDLLSPTLLSSFFIRYITIDFDNKFIGETGKHFDKDVIVGIYRVNNSVYELVDINNNKVRVPKDEINVNIKNAPLYVLLSFIN